MEVETLHRYLMNQTTSEEEAAIVEWLDASPDHREQMGELYVKMETLLLLESRIKDLHPKSHMTPIMCRQILRWVGGAVAAVLLCLGAAFLTDTHVRHKLMNEKQIIATLDAPLRYTLTDGTTVWLNANTTLEYPMAFTGCERTVRVAGEAMFDVVHDEKHPFIVETTTYKIKVRGTKFNVIADAEGQIFETALLQGLVEVTDRATGKQVILAADESVVLRDGVLVRRDVTDPDDYLWTDGYINLQGHTFHELIAKFSQVFGVSIETSGVNVPDTKFWRGKIRIQDGVDNAMKVLESAFPIQYSFNAESRKIIVRNK